MSEIWRCSWQNYRGFREQGRDPHPAVQSRGFESKEAAHQHKLWLQGRGMTATITQYVPRAQAKPPETEFLQAIKTWRLHQ